MSARYGVQPSLDGLSRYAKAAIKRTNTHFLDTITPSDLKDFLKNIQKNDAIELPIILSIEDIIKQIKSKIYSRHKQYYLDFIKPFDFENDVIENSFSAITASYAYNYEIKNLDTSEFDTLKHILSLLNNQFGKYYDSLLKIECPHCGFLKEKAFKEPKQTFLKCPHCNYYFSWNSYDLYNLTNDNNEEKDQSIWDKIRSKIKK